MKKAILIWIIAIFLLALPLQTFAISIVIQENGDLADTSYVSNAPDTNYGSSDIIFNINKLSNEVSLRNMYITMNLTNASQCVGEITNATLKIYADSIFTSAPISIYHVNKSDAFSELELTYNTGNICGKKMDDGTYCNLTPESIRNSVAVGFNEWIVYPAVKNPYKGDLQMLLSN